MEKLPLLLPNGQASGLLGEAVLTSPAIAWARLVLREVVVRLLSSGTMDDVLGGVAWPTEGSPLLLTFRRGADGTYTTSLPAWRLDRPEHRLQVRLNAPAGTRLLDAIATVTVLPA